MSAEKPGLIQILSKRLALRVPMKQHRGGLFLQRLSAGTVCRKSPEQFLSLGQATLDLDQARTAIIRASGQADFTVEAESGNLSNQGGLFRAGVFHLPRLLARFEDYGVRMKHISRTERVRRAVRDVHRRELLKGSLNPFRHVHASLLVRQ